MSKNMTRKGLALGATFALGAGLISGVPAVANGTADGSVSLLPNVGAEYVVRSGDVFDLKANYDASFTAANRFLKFLVEDSAAKTQADIDNNGASNDAALTTITGVTSYAISASGSVVTVVTAAAHRFQEGDVVAISGMNAGGSTAVVTNGNYTITSVPSSTSFTFAEGDATVLAATADADATIDAVVTAHGLNTRAQIIARKLGSVNIVGGSFPVSSRALDNSYVVRGIANDVSADQVLRLVSTDTTVSVSVKVTAWIDNNGNDEIDPTEKASPARTVSFLRSADISATTTIRPATAGEDNVVADVVLSPVLNGLMILAAANENLTTTTVTDAVAKVRFTRQGDATALNSITNGTYSNTTKRWTFTSENFDNSGWAETHATKPAAMVTANAAANDIASYSITSNVATIVTGAAHGFRVGDFVVVSTSGVTRLDTTTVGGRRISAVPTTTSFSYAVETAQESATNVASTANVAADKISVGSLVRNKVEAGLITAQFHFDTTNGTNVSGTNNNAVGAVATFEVGARVVGTSGLSIVGVPSTTVNAAGKVFKGTTSATFNVVVRNADGDRVGAGVDVTMTALRTAGSSTITANGLAVGSVAATTFYGKTDANGSVTITLTNATGAIGDTVALTANSQGATQATLSAVWEDKIYTIHDTADATYANSVRSRLVASGASYTMNFLVQDQWKAPAGADVRLLATVTGRTVNTQVVTLTNGTGSLVIPDGGLTTTTTSVQVQGQLRSATTNLWALDDASFADWDGVSAPDLAVVTINYAAAASINLNADGANFPSSTAADYTASVTSLTPVALDGRVSNAVAPAFTAASKAVVSGNVVNASGVATAGASVTLTGTDVAFKAGDVWALNTITFVTDGTFAVEVYSRTSGAKAIVVTSGAATRTATVTFSSLGTATGYTVALDVPETVVPGSTFMISGTLRDVNGNPIVVTTAGSGANPTLTVGYQGRGLVSGTLPTTTDANGRFFFYVLVGSTDAGQGVVTATYDADGTGTARAAVTVSKTVNIAPVEAVAKIGSFNGRVAVRVENAKGSTISVKIGRQWYRYSALNNNYLQSWKSRKGASVAVSVYVDGELQNVQTITVR